MFLIIVLYFYYVLGSNLERTWGAFRFNVYFFSGMLFHVIAAIIVYLLTGLSLPLGTSYLNLSLFFAFAAMYPDLEFLHFFRLMAEDIMAFFIKRMHLLQLYLF